MTATHTAAVFMPSRYYTTPAIPPVRRMGENIPMGYLRNLKAVRQSRGMTQGQLAELVGVEQPTIQRYEGGRSPSISQAIDIAQALGVSLNDLVTDSEPFVDLGPKLPVVGAVAAGRWAEAWQDPPEDQKSFMGRADVRAPLEHRYGVRVEGDSMNALYPPGTILECVSAMGGVEIENGRRVIVSRRRNGTEYEVTVKEYFQDADGVEWLVPRSHNPAFQTPIRADQQEEGVDEVRIIAVVVGSYRPE